MVGRIENISSFRLPIDTSSKLPLKAKEALEAEGKQAVVVHDLSGKSAIVTVIEPRVSRKKPDNTDPFPPAA